MSGGRGTGPSAALPPCEALLSLRQVSTQLQVPRALARELVRSGRLGPLVRNRSGHLLVRQGALNAFQWNGPERRRWGQTLSDSELFWLYEADLPPDHGA